VKRHARDDDALEGRQIDFALAWWYSSSTKTTGGRGPVPPMTEPR
jgi:hypothetical protein